MMTTMIMTIILLDPPSEDENEEDEDEDWNDDENDKPAPTALKGD